MNKRPGFIVIVIIFIAAIVGFYIFLKKQQSPGIQPISAVPINSALIIEIKKPLKFFEDIAQKNGVYKKLNQITEVNHLNELLGSVDSLIKGQPKLFQLFDKTPLMVSLHDVGNHEFHPLFIMPVSSRYEINQIFKAIEGSLDTSFRINSERYNQAKLYKIAKGTDYFFYSYQNGLFMASNSELLIEDAIRQSESTTNLLESEGLKRLRETSGDHAEANIYIQFKFFENFLFKAVSEEYLKDQSIKQVGDWVELDLNLKNQTILFNGFAFSDATANRFMNIFEGQVPQNIKFLRFIPASSEGFWGFGLSNYKLYKQNLRKYMEQAGDIDRYNINNKKIRDTFGENAETDLEQIFKNELVQVQMPDKSSLFYIKTRGFRDGSELINKWIKYYCSTNNENLNERISNFSIDKESVFPIYKMPIDYLPTRLLGPYFKTCKANYVTVFDDYIIFGDSYNALARTIYDNVLQKTLVYDGAFTQYADYLSTKVNFFGFISLAGTAKVLESRMSNSGFAFYKNNQETLRDFYAVAWQFANENNLYYNNILFRHQPSNTLKAATEWETRLDTVIAFKPELVINHNTKEKEIFVQDEKYNVYLINNSGRILWKKNIAEPIMGEVFQVDYYKNGKLQYLFNTKTKIHLLDRNGNFVERYPIKLEEAAAAPMSVFEYENRKNYRLFIPFENNHVEVFNIEGKVVSGFKFQKTDNKIISPVQYVRDNNKDYIIITDESRIYILDRQGNERVTLKKQFKASVNNIFEYQAGNNNRNGRLVRTDENGTVYYVYFDGEVEIKQVQSCSASHYFNVEDINDDRVNDFIFIDANMLQVYDLSGKEIYKYKFSTNIEHKPTFYRFSANKTYLGVTEASSRKIYLFDGKGDILNGFPLVGKTRFSIGFLEPGSGRFNLVVGGDEYYLYNFKLN